MVHPKTNLPSDQLVLCGKHFASFACHVFIGCLQSAQRQIDPLLGNLTVDGCEAFGQCKFVRQAQNIIEDTDACFTGIVFDRNHRRKFGTTSAAIFDRVQAKTDTLVRNMIPQIDIVVRFQNRAHFTIVQSGQKLEQF